MKKPIILVVAAAIGLGTAGIAGAAGTPRAVSCPPGNSNPAYCTTTPDNPPPTTTTNPPPTTPAPQPPPSSNPGQPPTVIADADGKSVDISYSCPATAKVNCTGTLILRADDGTRSTRAHASRVVEIGRTTYNIAPGQTATVKVPLTAQGQQLLASRGSVTVNAAAIPQGSTQEIPAGTVTVETAASSSGEKKAPKAVSAKASPKRDKSKPYAFKVSGKITLPAGMAKSGGCSGTVNVAFTQGKKKLLTKSAKLSKSCSYSANATLKKAKKGKVKVVATFSGNTLLRPKAAKALTVTAG